jgi:predicted XRE-type DNA-binding protein
MRITKKKSVPVHTSRGNVFADLGVRNPREMLAKAKLVHRICAVIAERGLNQTEAAEAMMLDQPKVSALMRGKLKGISADRLFRCLHYLGLEVEFVIRPIQRAGPRGSTGGTSSAAKTVRTLPA